MFEPYEDDSMDWDFSPSYGLPNEFTANDPLDLSQFSSWQEIAAQNPKRVRASLSALRLCTGGTVEQRAKRLFNTKGQKDVDKSWVPKMGENKAQTHQKHKDTAAFETQVYRFANIVGNNRSASIENVMSRVERAAGKERDESGDESDDSATPDVDFDEVPHNPHILPRGIDGKPIPYWLYKLRGLNICYSCEICGNYTYRGTIGFQQHFLEWRHCHGMMCLGIPNTAQFAKITQIEEAVNLWRHLNQ